MSPIDPTRPHEVGAALAWHARVMVLGWGILAPLAVLMARYFKVLPGQDWPRHLDSKVWWRSHWIGQSLVIILALGALALILVSPQNTGQAVYHRLFGYAVLGLGFCQILSGLLRGSKGGPTSRAPDGSLRGDHYDMTLHRRIFETYHKVFGYLILLFVVASIASGLWVANAPIWMWLTIAGWFAALLLAAAILERGGRAVNTYQAIWGPDPVHPGNWSDGYNGNETAVGDAIRPAGVKRDI